MASAEDPWSNIPLDLACLVLMRLPAHVDRVRFAAVCPQWRSAARQVKLTPPMPLLALKEGDIFYSMPRGEPLHFAGCETGFATACGKWLVYRRDCDMLLVDPFSGATMTLPAPTSFHLPGESEGEDSEGGHDSADEGDDSVDGSVYTDTSAEMMVMDFKYSQVIKLVVCSPNLIAALFLGSQSNWVAVCQPGGSMWSVAWDLSLWTTEMAFYQGKLYVVDNEEDLLALDISVDDKTGDPRVARIRWVFNVHQFDHEQTWVRMLYLAESCGSLLLVRRRIFHTLIDDDGQIHTFAEQHEPDLWIFEADFARSQWAEVTALADNQALFLGPCSRAICMPQGDPQGNRVWFLDDYKDFHLSSYGTSVENPRPFSPLPMISWRGYNGFAGAAWLFPAN